MHPLIEKATETITCHLAFSFTLFLSLSENKFSDLEDTTEVKNLVYRLLNTEMELVDTPKLQEQKQENFHVLVVDDSVIDRKLLERLLRDSSCKATFVDSGDKALKYLGLLDGLDNASSTSSESFQQDGIKVNLIMTDYCMPGMSGYDLLKRIKLQGSSWKDVPVVIMSSENVPSRISMCLEGGAEEFLLKPLQLSDLKKPYFLKSLDNSSQQENDNSSLASNNDNNNNSNNNNNANERKSIFQRHGFKFQSPTKIVAAILQFWKSP